MSSPLRKHATSIGLVIAAVTLGGYIWLVDRDNPSTSETQAREDNLLTVFRREQLGKIEIEQEDRKVTLVRREDDAGDHIFLFMVGDAKPQDAPHADQVAVERLIQALEFATRLRQMQGDFDLVAAGLAPPERTITLQMGSRSYRIGVGREAKTPAGARYVKVEGEGVFVIPKAQAQELMASADSFRARRLVPYTSSKLESLELLNEAGETKLMRAQWGGFRVASLPGKPRVSRFVFDRLLAALSDATAERFLDVEEGKAALAEAKSQVRLVLVPKKGEREEIVIGGTCPSPTDAGVGASKLVVLERTGPEPTYACIPSSVLVDLQTPPAAFADRRALSGTPDGVESIEIERGEATLELIRKGGGWHVRKPEDRQIPSTDVEGFLSGLLAIEGSIVDTPNLAELGLEPPRGTVTLRHPTLDDKEQAPQALEIGGETTSDAGPVMAVRRKQDGVVLLVPAVTDRLFQASTTLIRSTELLSVNPLRMKKIDVLWEGGVSQTVHRRGAGFEMIRPKGYEVDASLAADLFEMLSHLKAERWVTDLDDGTFGLGKPSIRVALAFEDKKGSEQKRELLLGDSTAGGRFASWKDEGGVFVLPRSLTRVLGMWVLDRSVFMIDPNEVKSLSVRSKDRELRIVAKGETWQTLANSSVQLSTDALSKLRQTLIDMRAEGAVHLGPAQSEEGMKEPLLRITMTPRPTGRNVSVELTIGRADVWRETNVYYARRKGIDATFAIARSKVQPILDALGRDF